MIRIRREQDRGRANHGWLKSKHTFSFADYYDPGQMGFRALRVINEDRIAGGSGFGTHPHRDMEILSYVISGALEHKDSMGNSTVILPGEVQRMSAGTGIAHSEFNHFSDKETHFLQIWILPKHKSITPSYGQKSFTADLESRNSVLAVSEDGREGSVSINQDVKMYLSRFKQGESARFEIREGRGLWLQIINGQVEAEGAILSAGDGAAIEDQAHLDVQALSGAEFLLFDLP